MGAMFAPRRMRTSTGRGTGTSPSIGVPRLWWLWHTLDEVREGVGTLLPRERAGGTVAAEGWACALPVFCFAGWGSG